MDMIEVMKKIGERTTGDRIALLMRERGRKQYELAQHLNKSASFVSQIVNDERGMTPEDAAKIADYLSTTMDYLYLRTDNPMPPGEEPEPHYWHAETDVIAQVVDALPGSKRMEVLAVVRAMAASSDRAMEDVDATMNRLRHTPQVASLVLGEDTWLAIRSILTEFALWR